MAENTSKPKKSKKTDIEQGVGTIQNILQLPPVSMEVLEKLEVSAPEVEEVYMLDASKPLHTNFLVANKGKKSSCPVFFGSLEEKKTVVDRLCSHIHPQTLQQWGTFSCYCDVVPRLKLSKTAINPNRLFVCCPKPQELKCRFFQWIDKPPLPRKSCNTTALKRRFREMAEENMQATALKETFRQLAEQGKEEGGFTFVPQLF